MLGIVLVLSVALIIFLGETGWLDSRDWTRAAEGTQKLLFVWHGWMIWRIVRNRRLLLGVNSPREWEGTPLC